MFPYMHKLMPRGLSFVTITKDDQYETVAFYGFRKFSGMEDDVDTLNIEKANLYFRQGSMVKC